MYALAKKMRSGKEEEKEAIVKEKRETKRRKGRENVCLDKYVKKIYSKAVTYGRG